MYCSSPAFHKVVERIMTSAPSHESTLREIIADVISRHIFEQIQDPEIVHILDSFGNLGTLVIAILIRNELVKSKNDILQEFSLNITSSHRCRYCLRLISGDFGYRGFRCASCVQ